MNFVEIDEEKCDFCAQCVYICPKQLLESYALKARAYVRASRWFLCDGCGACVKVCDRGAIQVGSFAPSFMERSICYFNEPGPQNTLKVCELVALRVKNGIRYVVVASGSGSSALEFLGSGGNSSTSLFLALTVGRVWRGLPGK